MKISKNKENRKERIEEIKKIIFVVGTHGEKTSYTKIIAEYCLKEGLSKRTVKEYLDLLVDSGQVIKEGDSLSIGNICSV